MSAPFKVAALIAALALLSTVARSDGISNPKFLTDGFAGGISGKAIASGPPPTTCASTGVFDLSNVCNDIYFIGALK